jgi:hypothetical protein
VEIIIPGGTRRSKEGAGTTGYSLRLAQVRKSVGYLPPWRCQSFVKGAFYLCGHCFGLLGDGPATNAEEMWMVGTDRTGAPIIDAKAKRPVVPQDARCEKCGGHAWPAD